MQPPEPEGKSILLVEDEPGVRSAFNLMLSLDHHTVTEAGDGAEALEVFRQAPFDLVITDYSMPRMKGDELAKKIRQLVANQPILMITAYRKDLGDPNNPIDAVLSKPFELKDLRRTVAKLLQTKPSPIPASA